MGDGAASRPDKPTKEPTAVQSSAPLIVPDLQESVRIAHIFAAAHVPLFIGGPSRRKPGKWQPYRKAWQSTPASESVGAIREFERAKPGTRLLGAVQSIRADTLDSDPRNGGMRDALPTGLMRACLLGWAKTPSGGEHFLVPPLGLHKAVGFLPGIDYQGGAPDGQGRGLAWVAGWKPSKDPADPGAVRGYRWLRDPDLDREVDPEAIAELRAWLAERIGEAAAERPSVSQMIAHGARPGHNDDDLSALAFNLRADGLPESDVREVWWTAARRTDLTGEPFTDADFDRHWRTAERKQGDVPPLDYEERQAIAALDAEGLGSGQPSLDKAFDKDVRAERRRQRIVRTARHLDAAEAWETPEDAGSLAEQAAEGIPEPSWLVKPLIPSEGFAQIVAQWKAGKTTLASVNLAVDLAARSPFLGAYDTDLPAGRNVGIWNLEVGAATLQRWMMKRGADDAALKRIFPLHLRGRPVDLMAPVAAVWTAEWLERNGIAVWIIDPLSRLYHGKENDPTEFTAWWGALEKIARLGGVDVVILVHHAGHAPPGESDSKPRARGASSMMGNPDVLISYRHAGGIGEAPSGPARYLSAFGRDVDFEEITLRFDSATQELRTDTGSKGRKHDALRSLAKRAADVIEDSGPMNATELKAAMGRAKDEDKVAAIRIAVSGFELIETKKGQAKVYSRGTGKVVQRGGDEQ
jgi:hypothetical protein